ncbi:hypothetical protein [Sphingobacterium sp. UBA1498]|uniref:hypothetical protein n=1 Tax=Sphingobacterium sp. UBA1498 TaxID=1947481 RepID=UPI0025F2DD70|nr:hypothetical protein [Sphingobacterium sp. UBA1498]
MSGSASIRGFVYQTIISVITSLEEDGWDFCQVEPEIGKEKADIIFWKNGRMSQAIQVKSSQNAFTATEAKDWLGKLVENLPESQFHKLILIGNCESNLTDYIKKVRNGEEFSDRENGEVEIRLIPFDQDYLSSTLENKMRKFFENKGYFIQQKQLEMLTHSLLYSFLEFSITSEKVSKEEFSSMLINWAKTIFPKSIRMQNDSELRVYLYDENTKELKEKDKSRKMLLGSFRQMIEQCNQDIKDSFEICKTIVIDSKISEQNELVPNFKPLQISALMESYSNAVIVPEYVKEALKIYIKEEFDEQVENQFFEIGDLRELSSGLTSNLYGSEKQKAKFYAIFDLYYTFSRKDEIKHILNMIEFRSVVSLVLKNEGKGFDEEIEVFLEISSETDLLRRRDFPKIESRRLIKEIIGKKFPKGLLEIKSDHLINRYPFNTSQFAIIRKPKNMLPFSNEDKIDCENNTRQFEKYLQGYMDFEYNEGDSKQYLKFEFPKLNPNQIVAFPCRLFLFKERGEIKIEYHIRSKHSSDTTIRDLIITVETN